MPDMLYVGLQDDDKIAVFAVDGDSGALTKRADVAATGAPSVTAISPDRMRPNRSFLLVNGSSANGAVRRDRIHRDIAALVIGAKHITAGAVWRQKGRRIRLHCGPQ